VDRSIGAADLDRGAQAEGDGNKGQVEA